MIDVVIIEETHLLRVGIENSIQHEEVRLVGSSSSWKEGLGLIEKSKPNIVIMDAFLSDSMGVYASEYLHRHFPEMGIILLSKIKHLPTLKRLLLSSARGLLTKDFHYSWIDPIKEVYSGSTYVQPDLSFDLIKYQSKIDANELTKVDCNELTDREYTVLMMLSLNRTYDQIASTCFISTKTVANIKSKGFKKMGIKSILQLRQVFN